MANRVSNPNLTLNFTLLGKGESTTVEVGGVATTLTQQGLASDAGGIVAQQSNGSYAVVVAEGGVTNGVKGIQRLGNGLGAVGQIPFPDFLVTAHELFSETMKLTPEGIKAGLIDGT